MLLLSIGLWLGGSVVRLLDFQWGVDCKTLKGCDGPPPASGPNYCLTGENKGGLCRLGTCEGTPGKLTCVGKYAAETGGYVMMGAGAVGVVAAVVLAVMAVRKART